jgi:hypothetical protein
MRAKDTLVMMALALSGAACAASGSGDPPPAPSGPSGYPDVQSYAQARAAAECNATVVQKCGVSDASTCITNRVPGLVAAAPQGTTYNPAAAPACIAAVTDAYSNGTVTADAMAEIDDLCGPKLFSGPGEARAQCLGPYDCDSSQGLTCLFAMTASGPASTGQCLKPNVVAAAGACPGEADLCSDGYYCDFNTKVCTAEGGAGETCWALQPCAKGLTCSNAIFNSSCVPKFGDGHGCQQDSDCANGLCDKANAAPQGNCAGQITLSSLDSLCAVYE